MKHIIEMTNDRLTRDYLNNSIERFELDRTYHARKIFITDRRGID